MFFLNRLQHVVMHHFGPFLIAVAWPGASIYRGMPRVLQRLVDAPVLVTLTHVIQQPILASVLFVGLVALWLVPPVHFVAMIDPKLYQVMNWSMVVDGLLFWVLVLDPRPKPPAWVSFGGRAAMAVAVIPPQILFGALLAFSSRDLYGFYDWCGRIYPSIGALDDQQLGGLIVWIPPAMMSVLALILVLNALRLDEERQRWSLKTMKPGSPLRDGLAASGCSLALATLLAASAVVIGNLPAIGAETDLVLSGGYMQTIIPSVPVAGYFTLENKGEVDRELVGASSPGCGSVMLHKSEEVNGVASMRHVDSVPVPAHKSITFAPGGFHLMCMSPTASLTPGSTVPVTLSFKNGGTLTSDFSVRAAGAGQP
jgi:copper(I)-binding protein